MLFEPKGAAESQIRAQSNMLVDKEVPVGLRVLVESRVLVEWRIVAGSGRCRIKGRPRCSMFARSKMVG